jgi:hypothetical protein
MRLVERDIGYADHRGRDRPFLQGRYERRAKKRKAREAREQKRHPGEHRRLRVIEGIVEQFHVRRLHHRHDLRVVLGAAAQQIRAQHRRHRERDDERDEERDRYGIGEGREHLAFHPLQGHERQEHEHDDPHAVKHRLADLDGCPEHHEVAALARILRLSEVPKRVLDHDHGAVDHDADGDGEPSEGHQVGGDAEPVHRHEGDQGCDDEGCHHDQARSNVPEEKDKDDDHEYDAFQQNLGHGPQCGIDQLGAVVERHDLQPVRQDAAPVDLFDLGLHAAHHIFRVAAAQHHDDATGRLGVAVLDQRALAHFGAEGDLCHVPHEDRRAVHFLQHDALDVLETADQPHPANEVLLRVTRQDAAAAVGIVAGERGVEVLHRKPVVDEPVGIGERLVLLDESTLRVDLRHTPDAAQPRAHDPVLNRSALGELLLAQHPVTVTGLVQRVLVDFAQAGGERA